MAKKRIWDDPMYSGEYANARIYGSAKKNVEKTQNSKSDLIAQRSINKNAIGKVYANSLVDNVERIKKRQKIAADVDEFKNKKKETLKALDNFGKQTSPMQKLIDKNKTGADIEDNFTLQSRFNDNMMFNQKTANALTTTEKFLKSQGYNEEEIKDYFIADSYKNNVDAPQITKKLKEIEEEIKPGKENALYSIKEGIMKRQVENMISRESAKELRGLSSNRYLIEDWLQKHPDIEQDEDTGFISSSFRGLADFTYNTLDTTINYAKEHPMETVALLGGGLLISAGIAATGGIGAAAVSPLIASGTLGGAIAESGTAIALTGLAAGTNSVKTAAMWEQQSANDFESQVAQGIDPDVARIYAMTTGTINTMIEELQFDTAFKSVPFVTKGVEQLKTKGARLFRNKAFQLAKAYGLEIAEESAEEVTQEYVSNLSLEISKRKQGGESLPSILLNSEKVNPLNEFDLYKDVALQTAHSMWLMPLLKQAGHSAIKATGKSVSNAVKAKDDKYFQDVKSFTLDGGVKKIYDVMDSDKATPSQKTEVAELALKLKKTYDSVDNANISGLSKKEKKELGKLRESSTEVFEKYLTQTKKENPNIYYPASDIETNKEMLVRGISEDIIDPDLDIENFTGLNKETVNNYNKAKSINGLEDDILRLNADGKKRVYIAEKIIKQLPKKERKKINASMYVNAVLDVNKEAQLQSDKARMAQFTEAKRFKEGTDKTTEEYIPTITEQKNVEKRKEAYEAGDGRVENPNPVIEPVTEYKDQYADEPMDLDKVTNYEKADVYKVNVNDINVDPERFQFRAKGTSESKFKGTPYDENLAGVMHLYRDTDGQLYALDGHHRLQIAQDSDVGTVKAQIIDSKDMNVKEARMLGATINIAEDHATGIDVASLIKNNELEDTDLSKLNIRPNSKIAINGKALAGLEENLFNKVLNNSLSEERGAEIAKAYPNEFDKQLQLAKLIDSAESSGKYVGNEQIKWYKAAIRGSMEDGINQDFFGDYFKKNYTYEKVDLMSYAENEIKKNKNLISKLTKNKNLNILKSLDNEINVEGNKKFINESDVVLQGLQNAFKVGNEYLDPVLLDYAKNLQENPSNSYIKKNFLSSVMKLFDEDKIDAFGFAKKDYKAEPMAAYQLEKADLKEASALFDPDYKGERVFKYNGIINNNLADKLNGDGALSVFVNDKVDSNSFKDLMIPIEALKKNDYFKDVAMVFNGEDETRYFSKEELENAGYKGYEAGNYTIKGQHQKINGDRTRGIQGVFLSNKADRGTIVEEAIHVIVDKERENGTQLYKDIEAWSKGVSEKAKSLNIEIPTNDELFTQAFLYTEGGFADKNPLISSVLGVDDNLASQVKNVLGADFVNSAFGDNVPKDLKYNKPLYHSLDLERGKIKADTKAEAMANMNLNVNSEKFKTWFGESEVKDYKGEPLLLYGRDIKNEVEFFEKPVDNHNSQEVYVKIENPYKIKLGEDYDETELINSGYDGVIVDRGSGENSYIVLGEPTEQAVSVYDDGSIHYQLEENKETSTDKEASGEDIDTKVKENKERKVRGFFENLKGRVSDDLYNTVKDLANNKEEYDQTYEVHKNIDTIMAASDWIAENGEDKAYKYLMNKDQITNDLEMTAAQILAKKYDDEGSMKAVDLVYSIGEKGTDVAQMLQSMSIMEKLSDSSIMKLATKFYDENLSDKDKAIITKQSKGLLNNIKDINKKASDNIDASSIISAISNMKDSDLTIEQLRKQLGTDDFNNFISEVEANTKKSRAEILAGNIDESDLENVSSDKAKEYLSSIEKANNFERTVTSENMKQKVLDVRSAVKKYYSGKSNSGSLISELQGKGFSSAEAELIQSSVLNSIGDMTLEEKTNLFKNMDKSKKGAWQYALQYLNDNENISQKALEGEVATMNKKGGLTHQNIDTIRDKVSTIKNMEHGKERQKEIDLLTKELSENVPATLGRKLASLQTISMLLNGRTTLRNITGNTIFGGIDTVTTNTIGSIVDKMMEAKTGERTRIHRSYLREILPNRVSGFFEGLKQGTNDALAGVEGEINPTKFNIYSDDSDISYNAENGDKISIKRMSAFNSEIGKGLEKVLGVSLRATDVAAMTATVTDSMSEQIEIFKRAGKEITDIDMKNFKEQAMGEALYRTFNDDTALSSWGSSMKQGLNKMQPFKSLEGFGLGDILLKFPKTPANILMRGIDYSPIGLADGMLTLGKVLSDTTGEDFALQKIGVDKVARGLAGTGLISMGALLYGLGVATPARDDEDDSDKVKNFKESIGIKPMAINVSQLKRLTLGGGLPRKMFKGEELDTSMQVGDNFATYDWNQPISIPLSLGVALATGNDSGMSLLGNVGEAMKVGVKSLVEQPFLTGITEVFKYKDPVEGIASALVGVPATFVPSIINQVGQFIDPTSRDTKGDNALQTLTEKVMYKLPILKEKLPARKTAFGEDITWNEYCNIGTKFINTFINPANMSKLDADDTEAFIYNLYNNTGDNSIIPSDFKKSFSYDGVSYELDKSELAEVRGWRGALIKERLDEVVPYLVEEDYDNNIEEIARIIKDTDKEVKESIALSKEMASYE